MNLGSNLKNKIFITLATVLLFMTQPARADDGYRLWLRYDVLPENSANKYRENINFLNMPGDSPTIDAARSELMSGLKGLLGSQTNITPLDGKNALIVGTPKS